MDTPLPPRISRRKAVKWMLTASASIALLREQTFGADPVTAGSSQSNPVPEAPPSAAKPPGGQGYGTDPDLLKTYQPGELWPLTLSESQRRTVTSLCDIIIPADDHSPSASAVGVPDFIDEWISAPYPANVRDRAVVLPGLAWLDTEATKRFGKIFSDLNTADATLICDDICFVGTATQNFLEPAYFFALFRNLTAGGFYTTAEGMKDLQYVGNVPIPEFLGPPDEALKKVGLL